MEGKIFSDSSNIYQDQARILFDYYKEAAQKIVEQEIVIEEKVKNIEEQIVTSKADLEKNNSQKTVAFVLGGVAIVGAVALFIFAGAMLGILLAAGGVFAFIKAMALVNKGKALGEYIASNLADIEKAKVDYQNIFRDYKVEKLGIAYVPVASRVAYNGKSFLVDHTGSTSYEKFTLQILRQNDLINSSISDLRRLTQEAPIVEESGNIEKVETSNYSRSIQSVNFHDYFGKLDRTLRTISYCLSDKDETTVELPVIYPNSAYANFLAEHATSKSGDNPIFSVFNIKKHDEQINGFKMLNETRKSMSSDSQEIDQTLRHLMVDMATSVQTTSAMKVSSVGSLIDYSNRIMFNILKAPYNFYSPMLEAEEIERIKNENFNYGETEDDYRPFDLRESSRMRFDLISMCWVDESGGKTIAPFGVNQIQSEIMAPIVTNLLKDTYKDRLDIYNNIKDQKIDYINQWHRDTEDFYGRNRAEASDLINLMRANFTDYTAAYNTLVAYKNTEENMRNSTSLDSAITETNNNSAEVLVAYQQQSEQFREAQNEFADYMERLHDDIDLKSEKFGHVEYYDASLRDKRSRDSAVAIANVSNLDDRRKPLAEVSPLLAETSDLPPAPSVEDVTYEHVGLNLMTMAQEALDDLEALISKEIKHNDSFEPTIEEEDDDEPVVAAPPTEEEPIIDEEPETEEPIEEPETEEEVAEEETETEEEEIEEEIEETPEEEPEIEEEVEEEPEPEIEEDEEEETPEAEEEEEIEEEEEELEEEEEEELEEEEEETPEEEEESEEEEEAGYTVGMELYDLDEDGNKVYYDDGEYADEESGLVVVVVGGKISQILPLTDQDN